MDETTVQVLHEMNRPAESQSYMWLTCGYEKGQKIILFHYHPTRKKLVAENALEGFSGYLQTEATKAIRPSASGTESRMSAASPISGEPL
jgi:hypothetical protein